MQAAPINLERLSPLLSSANRDVESGADDADIDDRVEPTASSFSFERRADQQFRSDSAPPLSPLFHEM